MKLVEEESTYSENIDIYIVVFTRLSANVICTDFYLISIFLAQR